VTAIGGPGMDLSPWVDRLPPRKGTLFSAMGGTERRIFGLDRVQDWDVSCQWMLSELALDVWRVGAFGALNRGLGGHPVEMGRKIRRGRGVLGRQKSGFWQSIASRE
jgi:hypothetical protein